MQDKSNDKKKYIKRLIKQSFKMQQKHFPLENYEMTELHYRLFYSKGKTLKIVCGCKFLAFYVCAEISL